MNKSTIATDDIHQLSDFGSGKKMRPSSAYTNSKVKKVRPMTAKIQVQEKNPNNMNLARTEYNSNALKNIKNETNLGTSEGTYKRDQVTRPSTTAYEGLRSPSNPKIRKAESLNKSKIDQKEQIHRELEDTLKRNTGSAEKQKDTSIQMYYKSIEPFFKKQKHISGYQAIVTKKSDGNSDS